MMCRTMEEVLGVDRCGRWEAVLRALPPVPEGWLYHGTSLQAALAIMAEGFRHAWGRATDDRQVRTYWGSVATARNFASRPTILGGGPPAILQARVEDVVASGAAMPMNTDDNCEADHPDWRASLAACQSIWVLGGRHVRGLTLHTI